MCDVGTANRETNFSQNLVGSKPLNMPIGLFKTIVDQSKKFYPWVKIGYAFTEPLVYPHLGETLIYARQNGIFTSLTTNGLNLKRKTDQLLEGGVREIYISLDGLQDTHNFIRGNDQSFQKAIEGIQHLVSFRERPLISVFYVITQWNQYEMKKFADFFVDIPITRLGFLHQNFVTKEMALFHNDRFLHSYPATHSNIEVSDFSKIDFHNLQNEISQIKSLSFPFQVSFSPELETIEDLENYYLSPNNKIGGTCNDLFSNLMIKSDGNVIPAHGRCYNVPMGNLYQQSLPEIWNSPAYNKFRKTLMANGGQLPACTRCCSAF
ncbi:MAG: SPASM domain-containing protein [Saprospiraceae bacterium]|nr:SPASM domain-containing protein [Saprospiraceae bacterium]